MPKDKSSFIEDLWIECQCYKELVLDGNFVSRRDLKALVKEAKGNSEARGNATKAIRLLLARRSN